MIKYERVYPPGWQDKHDPRCPECGAAGLLFYVGMGLELTQGAIKQPKLFQCSTCLGLYREVEDKL